MADLITTARAVQASTLASLNATNPAQLASLIRAASDAIRRHCHRDFTLTSYSEYYSGAVYINESLKLRQFPVTQINRIAIANVAIQVLNSGASVQRATVQTLSSGDLQLITVANGISSTNTISAASNVTLGQVATAITALGNGWATSMFSGPAGIYANFPTVDLKPLQGAASALIGGCYLEIYEDWYGWNTMAFWPDENYESNGVASFWRLDNETGEIHGRLPRGKLNVRIDYTAGFSTIPESVQQACVDLTQWLYQQGESNQAYREIRLGASAEVLNEVRLWPPNILNALSYYKAFDRSVHWS